MSDTLVDTARPRQDFSSPAFHREAVRIQYVYATLASAGAITKQKLIKALSGVPGFLYWSDAALTDRYFPWATVYFRVPRGKIAIVFPKCADPHLEDGTPTDRSLTVHFIAEVQVRDMVELTMCVLSALAAIAPGDVAETECEPCGFARLG